ncbi:MAG: hypothetical protein KC483_10835 [Nitrosarchaeum sp.]|nr:hypothetical protein [Nitrosarchaeum sp.]
MINFFNENDELPIDSRIEDYEYDARCEVDEFININAQPKGIDDDLLEEISLRESHQIYQDELWLQKQRKKRYRL